MTVHSGLISYRLSRGTEKPLQRNIVSLKARFHGDKSRSARSLHYDSNLFSALYIPKDLNSFLDFKKQMSGAPNDFSVK